MGDAATTHPDEAAPLVVRVADAAVNTRIHRYTFKDVSDNITQHYIYPETNSSMICDIIAMYLKGQKILYTESKTVCEQRLNYLMLPAILITAICTILSLVLKDISYGPTIVSCLNGTNAFLLALINYLKLDAKAEAHRTAAYKFDKLQSYLEFSSGRILFDSQASSKLLEIITKTENDVRDIKETNQFILPETIRFTYPKLYGLNVFSEVKKIQNKENLHVNRIKEIMNSILEIQRPLELEGTPLTEDDKAAIKSYETEKEKEIKEIIRIQDKYLEIDKNFEEEMEHYRNSIHRKCELCGWLKT